MMLKLVLFAILLFFTTLLSAQDIILQHVNLIDGSGSVKINQDIHIRAGKIIDVRHHRVQKQPSVQYISLKGKTMMPLLIDAHCHVGILKGTKVIPENYTAENIERQLHKYLQYGVGAVMSLGTDRKSVIPIRAASQRGEIEGATLYSAISGFGSEALPPANMSPEVLRPKSVAEAVKNVQDLTDLKPDMIKIWVEGSPKMKPEIYTAIIQEAHRHQIRVAAHVYQLEDARNLVKAGVDVIAHSIRDKEIDDELLKLMKQKAVVYIPTLTLDYYNFIYADQPSWLNDPFFKAALEPGVENMLTTAELQKLKADPGRASKIAAYQMAVLNLGKIFKAGIKVAMGTDSGAQPLRVQGFSEHLELELMMQAGLSALDVISVATANSASVINKDAQAGLLAKGKNADFMILTDNPADNIKATRKIAEVWKNGKKVVSK